jgi:hypothetical protein
MRKPWPTGGCYAKNKKINRQKKINIFNSLNAELNPMYHMLALLGAQHILHVSRIWVNYTEDVYSTLNGYGEKKA